MAAPNNSMQLEGKTILLGIDVYKRQPQEAPRKEDDDDEDDEDLEMCIRDRHSATGVARRRCVISTRACPTPKTAGELYPKPLS